jgi:arginase family enzyme
VSKLRARCPDCRAYTAVALGPGYQCHSCGREFEAALVRVPRAWGDGGEAMAEAAALPLPYPEAAVIEADTLPEQTFAIAAELPDRPLVLGGCCCAHVGAVEALAARHERVGVVWFDAHGDLNTVESSPSGNQWATPLRMLIELEAVGPDDVVLVGGRNLDPPELEFMAENGIASGAAGVDGALAGTVGVYVAFDADVVDPPELDVFMPEPHGLRLAQVNSLFRHLAARGPVLGLGFSGLRRSERNVEPLTRLAAALGL